MILNEPSDIVSVVEQLKALDFSKKWEVKTKEYKSSKTLEQLRLYWKWVRIIGQEFGYHENEMSEYLKEELIKPKFIEVKGKIRSVRPSISAMQVNEMSEYMTSVSRWAGGHGISLPHPEDMHDYKG